VDAAGQFLVDLEDLPDLAVLPVGGLRAVVFQRQAVLIDPLVRRASVGTSFCAPTTKITLAAPQAQEASWLPDAEAITRVPSRVTACTLPSA
jgi:hypothetical protein